MKLKETTQICINGAKHSYSISNWCCDQCGASVQKIDGIYTLSEKNAEELTGFDSAFFANLASMEQKNFWFCSRSELIEWAISKHSQAYGSFLEIGCGTGFVLQNLVKRFPNLKAYAGEQFQQGLAFAQQRMPGANFMLMDACSIPFTEQFDYIGTFDMLEHIEEDEQVMSEIYRALKPGGLLFITVPQHPWLWSPNDVLAHHVRRYTQKEIVSKLSKQKFNILEKVSFVTLLLPALMVSRMVQNLAANVWDAHSEFKSTSSLGFLHSIMDLERQLIRLGLRSPVGSSLLLVAQKT